MRRSPRWHRCAEPVQPSDCTGRPELGLAAHRDQQRSRQIADALRSRWQRHTESGRVLLSAGGSGHACQLCSYSLGDLHPNRERTGCPDQPELTSNPTFAGGAIAMAIAGLASAGAKRVLTGNDDNLVYNHQTHLNLTHLQLLPMKLTRSERCLSGHVTWELVPIDATASNVTLAEVFNIASRETSSADVTLEPYLHPLYVQAECACGQVTTATSKQWAQLPECPRCGESMSWRASDSV